MEEGIDLVRAGLSSITCFTFLVSLLMTLIGKFSIVDLKFLNIWSCFSFEELEFQKSKL